MSTSAACTQYESICDAYGGQGAVPSGVLGYSETNGVLESIPSARPAVETDAPSGALPFTGLDIGIIVGVALLLIALGFLMRRLGRKPA